MGFVIHDQVPKAVVSDSEDGRDQYKKRAQSDGATSPKHDCPIRPEAIYSLKQPIHCLHPQSPEFWLLPVRQSMS